jgi:hypothetical protein
MNKRADVSIILLTLMCVVLVGIAMANFALNSNKIDINIIDAKVLRNSYLEDAGFRVYLSDFSEKSLLKSYDSFVSDGKAISSYNSLTDKNFEAEFVKNLKETLKLYPLEGSFKNSADDIIKEDKNSLETSFDGEKLGVRLKNKQSFFQYSGDKNIIVFSSLYDLGSSYEANLSSIGLESIKRLNLAYTKCMGAADAQERKKCFDGQNLNFNSEVLEDSSGKKSIILTSKKKFVIGDELRNIRISLT